MLLPLSWLKHYLPTLPPAPKLADLLAMHGLDVEEIIDRRGQYNQVVVGEIVAIKPHPNADKLRLASVVTSPSGEAGSGFAGKGKPQEIVCGGPNIAVGQKVAVALVGAKLPNGMTIESRAIRGVTSNGMICAEDELGLGKEHSGIMVLDANLKVGTPFAMAMGGDDAVFDLAIPANRADLMSVRGLAREIAAMLGKKVKLPPPLSRRRDAPMNRGGRERRGPVTNAKPQVSVDVAAPKLCPVYTARVIRGVAVKPSPMPLQSLLRAVGMRPINNIVDAANFIMWEYGQPLHAFDAAKVRQGKITVRAGRVGEKLTTLDGQTRSLDPSMLVIADPAGPIALAGVMGGRGSEVAEQTTDIILESAIFDPVSIRKTSRKLGLMSEASKRFEKGLWPSLPAEASAAAAKLITDLAGGKIQELVSLGRTVGPAKTVTLDPTSVSDRLGMTVAAAKSKAVLTKLGFKVTGGKTWQVTIPTWRLDVSLPADLIDEVGRLLGYDHLPAAWPTVNHLPHPLPPVMQLKANIQNLLVGFGLTETISHAFYGQAETGRQAAQHFAVANPLDQTQHFLRRSLIPNLKRVLSTAADAGRDAAIFELGRVFQPTRSGGIERQQPWKLAIGIAVKQAAEYKPGSRVHEILEELGAALGAKLTATVGTGEVLIRGRTIEWSELDIDELHQRIGQRQFRLQHHPTATRDISAFIPDDLAYRTILGTLADSLGADRALLDLLNTKASYFKKDGRTSITLSVSFRRPDRALTREEVDALMTRLTAALQSLGATIR